MSHETTLLPCPFCGGEAEIVVLDAWYKNPPIGVGCSQCPAILAEYGEYKRFTTEAEAIAAWNTRATHGTLTAEQVREAVISADRWEKPMGNTGLTNMHLIIRDDGWQAIADELNEMLGNGTCEMIPLCSWLFECSKCSEKHHKDDLRKYNYCPNCGAKVLAP